LPKQRQRDNRLIEMALARGSIDGDAERVVRKLARSGYQAYLVGGCVRDLLLGRTPKDFDVATSAKPNEIRELFRNCRIIGRRFRLAHIFFGSKIIETSTFRANPRDYSGDSDELLIRRDNVFGSDIEDAQRRDFTVNGLFFDVETEEVIDHVGGLADLEARMVRTIGDPEIRFQEDPVRMLRAIKFAARLGFTIETATYDAILRHRDELTKCAPPRVLEEFYRLLRGGAARRSMELLTATGIDTVLCTRLAAMFRESQAEVPALEPRDEEEAEWLATWADERSLLDVPALELSFASAAEIAQRRAIAWKMLDQLDAFVARGRTLSNALLLAAIMSPFLADTVVESGIRSNDASGFIVELAQPILEKLRVARRDSERMRQVLLAQRRLVPSRRRRGRPNALVRREYFYDSLILYEITVGASGGDADELTYWRQFDDQDSGADDDEGTDAGGKRRRRRRGGRRRRRGDEPDDMNADMNAAADG
jgi:poly(A) polymerase